MADDVDDKTVDDSTETDVPTGALEMSDEAFADASFDDFMAAADATDSTDTDADESDTDSADENSDSDETDDKTDTTDTDDSNDTDAGSDDTADADTDEKDDKSTDNLDDADTTDDKADGTKTDETDTTDTDSKEVDPAKELSKLYEPFRANGKEIQVSNVDDALTLMKMGANYNKKMQGLKPNLKLIKMLDNNNLLSEEKLSYLIDLDKKNPEAIKKLIKDSEINPLDIDVTKDSEYKPDTYTVSDKEVELSETLAELKDSPSYATTLQIIGNKWDASSKQALADNPAIIRVINEHVETGVYEKINTEVDKQRMLGRLKDLSDVQAYKVVGDEINARNGFNTQSGTSTETDTSIEDKATKEAAVKARKRSASTTKSKASKKPAVDEAFNPLALPDDEFEKLAVKFV